MNRKGVNYFTLHVVSTWWGALGNFPAPAGLPVHILFVGNQIMVPPRPQNSHLPPRNPKPPGWGEICLLVQLGRGLATLGPARPGSAPLGSIQFGLDPAPLGSDRLAQLGGTSLGSVRLGSARLGPRVPTGASGIHHIYIYI